MSNKVVQDETPAKAVAKILAKISTKLDQLESMGPSAAVSIDGELVCSAVELRAVVEFFAKKLK